MILDPELGIRVALTGDHPWRGHSGELVRWERASFSFGPLPVVLLDNGQECFVMDDEQWRRA